MGGEGLKSPAGRSVRLSALTPPAEGILQVRVPVGVFGIEKSEDCLLLTDFSIGVKETRRRKEDARVGGYRLQ